MYAPTGTDNNAGAPQVITIGRTLFVSFMTYEDIQLHDRINGAGDNKLEVFALQTDWPDLLDLDYSSFLFMVDHGNAKSSALARVHPDNCSKAKYCS